MNKKRIDEMIPIAFSKLEKYKIATDGKILKAYRGGVSSFGAAVSMGSIQSAAAFFSANKSNTSYDRKKIGQVIANTLAAYNKTDSVDTIYDYYIKNNDCKEELMDAAVAVKLAINLYKLI